MTTISAVVPKRSIGFLCGMSTIRLGANVVWVSYNSILLPTLVENVMTAGKGLAVGLIGFFGVLVGVTVSILSGIISDHTSSKLGRRTPALLIASLLVLPMVGLPSLFLSPALRNALLPIALPIITISYIGMQFFNNVQNGAWWPLLVDVVPENQRGTSSGIGGLFTMLGSALGIVLITILNQNKQTELALWLIGGFLAVTGVVTVFTIRGKDSSALPSERISVFKAMRDMFKVRTRVPVFFWLVLAVFFAFMGLNSLTFFARYFFEAFFPTISPDAAFRTMGGISLLVTMASALVTGVLSDKIGRRSLLLGSMFVCAFTTLCMGLFSNYILFLIMAGIRAAATGPLMVVAPALASDLSPRDEAGQYMAYNNLSNGLSGALSSLIFGVILVTLTKSTFVLLFIISAILFLAGGILFAIKVPQIKLDARSKGAK